MFAEVFQDHEFYSHMPFLLESADESVMLFSKCDDQEHETGSRKWKIHFCSLGDNLEITEDAVRLETGLEGNYIECNPSAYVNSEGLLVVNFVAGLYKGKDIPIKYKMYEMVGYSLDSLGDAKAKVIDNRIKAWTGCAGYKYDLVSGSPYSSIENYDNKKSIMIKDKDDNEIILNLEVDQVLRVCNVFDNPDQVVITTGIVKNHRKTTTYRSYVYDITNDTLYDIISSIKADRHYKCSINGNLFAYAERMEDGFENRKIYAIKDDFNIRESRLKYERIE